MNEYPGKAEHYRSCLEIIAKEADGDRSTLTRYLDTGSKGQQARVCEPHKLIPEEPEIIKRNDIPAGLHNIG